MDIQYLGNIIRNTVNAEYKYNDSTSPMGESIDFHYDRLTTLQLTYILDLCECQCFLAVVLEDRLHIQKLGIAVDCYPQYVDFSEEIGSTCIVKVYSRNAKEQLRANLPIYMERFSEELSLQEWIQNHSIRAIEVCV